MAANSPHTSNATDSHARSTAYSTVYWQSHALGSLGDLQSYGSTNAQWGIIIGSCDVIGIGINTSNLLCPTPLQDWHVHRTSLHPLEPLNNDRHFCPLIYIFLFWPFIRGSIYCSFTQGLQHSATVTGGDQFVIQVISSERYLARHWYGGYLLLTYLYVCVSIDEDYWLNRPVLHHSHSSLWLGRKVNLIYTVWSLLDTPTTLSIGPQVHKHPHKP